MKPVPVPDRIAMCAAPLGEHDYWEVEPGEEPGSCLHNCECEPVVFVREQASEAMVERGLVEELVEVFADVTRNPHHSHPGQPAVSYLHRRLFTHDRAMAALKRARAALDQGEGERP